MDFELPRFKSIPEFFYKELNGLKPNTVREIVEGDERFELIRSGKAKVIEIENNENQKWFQRKIIDFSEWMGLMIISWEHDKMILEHDPPEGHYFHEDDVSADNLNQNGGKNGKING